MPYIPEIDRRVFDHAMFSLTDVISSRGISNGELNYLITYLGNLYISKHGLSYNTGSDVIKALECAKLEFYRRVMVPYEDQKNFDNGDVY